MSKPLFSICGFFQISFDTANNSTLINRTDCVWFQYLWTRKFLHPDLHPWICSSVSWFIVYGNLNWICMLLLCENCIYVELVHSAFQVYYILLLFCLFILLIFESLTLKLQLKILILKNCNIVELYVTLFCIFQVSC